jgi:CRP-like cAMP-binding protein
MLRADRGGLHETTQSAACLRFHEIEERLCRWILASHDRVGEDTIRLTQEFLAMMLGVQRPGVTLAAAQLQKAGFIKYRRGVIEVLDREGLQASSCDCYSIVRREHERLLC